MTQEILSWQRLGEINSSERIFKADEQANSRSQFPFVPSKEEVVQTIPDRVSKYGSQRYRVYLAEKLIGSIFARGIHHYARPSTEYIGVGRTFSSLSRAEEWLVECFHSLLERPIKIDHLNGIYRVFRGETEIGEFRYHEMWRNWSANYYSPEIEGVIQVDNDDFKTSREAYEFIINKSLEPKQPRFSKYVVRLESLDSIKWLGVEVNPETIYWLNWLAYYGDQSISN